jgi:hypothetical protein
VSTRAARERFTFETPQHLWDAAKAICVELNREYPYLAEFHLNADDTYRLFQLYTVERHISPHYGEMIGKTMWDVDWIERDQCYAYHQSGGGGSLRHEVSGIYWRHPSMLHAIRERTATYCDKIFRRRNRTRRIRRIPPTVLDGHEDLMKMLEHHGVDASTYYCQICEEYLPDIDSELCEHVWWCDDDSVLRGPGSPEYPDPCGSEDCWHCSRERVLV